MNKRILQLILAVIGMIPIVTGLLGLIPPGIEGKLYHIDLNNSIQGNVILDSNYRYFSGLWFALGVVMFSIIPTIERQRTAIRIIVCSIFIGGLGRVISMITFGVPSPIFVFFTCLELISPILLLLQSLVAKRYQV